MTGEGISVESYAGERWTLQTTLTRMVQVHLPDARLCDYEGGPKYVHLTPTVARLLAAALIATADEVGRMKESY